MKDFDNIEDWYKDELENFSPNPDKDVWNSLSNELDADLTLTEDNISDWYKREVTKLEERPDYTVWEKLSTKLDTTSVWDKLVLSLNRYEQMIWWRNTIFKGSALLLLLAGSALTFYNYNNSSETASGNSKTIASSTIKKKASIKPKIQNNNILVSAKDKTTNTTIAATNASNQTITTTITQARNKIPKQINSSPSITQRNILYASNEPITFANYKFSNTSNQSENKTPTVKTIERRTMAVSDISESLSSSDFLVKKKKNKIVFNSKRFSKFFTYGLYARRFYIGANVGFKKQGLITSIKENTELSTFNQADYLDFGSNLAFVGGFVHSDKLNFETNINLYSTAGYKRGYSNEGIGYNENLRLNYSSVSFLAKKMNTKSTFDNKVYSTNLIAGVYASYLFSQKSNVNGIEQNIDQYKDTDFGIVLGIEQDRYITKTLVITPGIRYNQGLTNISSATSSLESARNFSLEFNLGVKYIFLKKSN